MPFDLCWNSDLPVPALPILIFSFLNSNFYLLNAGRNSGLDSLLSPSRFSCCRACNSLL